jgi:thiol-disulfide isomerase/thioredoxin
MRPGICAKNMQKRIVLVLFALFLLPLVNADTEAPDESRMAIGGHAILLEHYTATWCDTCATVDPLVSEFVDEHTSRVVRVALHPNDHDPFGSALTTHRIGLKQAEVELPLPTFWFDGESELQGSASQSLLENELRSAELKRTDWIEMSVWWDSWKNSPHDDIHRFHLNIDEDLPPDAIITVFRLETLEMTSEIANNGIDVHHDVATQMISFSPNGSVLDSFDGVHGWDISTGNLYSEGGIPVYTLETYGEVDGFVTVIEDNGEVRGALGIHDVENPRNPEKTMNLALFWLVLALVTSSILVSRDK